MMEIWKSLKGIQENGDYYEVSNFGNVRSIDKIIEREKQGSYLKKGRVLKQTKNQKGYMTVALNLNGKEKRCEVQRLVAKAFILNPDGKPNVNHIDSDTTNNYVENLEWVTQKENIIHAQKHGNKNDSGENNYASKLSKHDANKIRELYDSKKYNMRQLGEMYSVSATIVWRIVNNKSYKQKG